MAMLKFEDYGNKYKTIKMERRDGILQMTLHTSDAELKWGMQPHEELSYAFYDVARDHENRCVIITGTGNAFCAEADAGGGRGVPIKGDGAQAPAGVKSTTWDHIYNDAKYLLMNHLNIEVPIIAAVNGPALIHAELAVLADIVIASDNAEFQDAPHFPNGVVPGDGVHVVWPLVLGPNRGRYFLLTARSSVPNKLLIGRGERNRQPRSACATCVGARQADHQSALAGGPLCPRRNYAGVEEADARSSRLWPGT
jgi:enoyl-CoA hydratase/carnithine racemase